MLRILLALILILVGANVGMAICFQDQYGNQWDFEMDLEHKFLYGHFYAAGDVCDAPFLYVIGSWVKKKGIQKNAEYEFTASNPLGDSDTVCFPVFKIKGKWPNGAWYYTSGYDGQEFQFVPCGSATSSTVSEPSSTGKGALK